MQRDSYWIPSSTCCLWNVSITAGVAAGSRFFVLPTLMEVAAVKFVKKLNNNVVLATDKSGHDVVLFGRGLGFDMRPGGTVDSLRIEKTFTARDHSALRKLQVLLDTVPADYLEVAEETHRYATQNLRTPISDTLIVHLADHMHMAVTRADHGAEVPNMMLQEIKRFYAEEFQVGMYSIGLMNERFNADFDEAEAGFLALHVVNAQLASGEGSTSLTKITDAIQEIERIVRMCSGREMDTNSVHYRRFVTHLKFFAERLFQDQTHRGDNLSRMLANVKETYPDASGCVEQVGEFLQAKYDHTLSDDEYLYLTVHVAHLTS